MTGTEIQTQANYHTEGDTVDATSALKFINECLIMDLGKDAKVVATATPIAAVADTWYALPADLLEIFEIIESGEDYPYFGNMYGESFRGIFDVRDGYIRFPVNGTFTIKYYKVPAAIAALTDTPAVHTLFHYPISLYVASRYKSYDDEENADAVRLMNEYQVFKQKAIRELAKVFPSTQASRTIRRVWGVW